VTGGFWLSYTTLCCVQGLLVLTPLRRQARSSLRLVGLLVPGLLLVVGVLLVRDLSDGARGLTELATFGTPVAAAFSGVLLGWRQARLVPVLVVALYLIAWLSGGLAADAAGVLLIAGACLGGAALLGRMAGQRELASGLVLLVVLDVILVFGTSQVEQTTTTLHSIAPPSIQIAGSTGHLPALQDATFGSALMGWLDLLSPALLGVTLAGSSRRAAAALAVVVTAVAWGSLLWLTPEIPATVPVLAGLVVAYGPKALARGFSGRCDEGRRPGSGSQIRLRAPS
jgi:hypothetical protein